MRVGGQLVRGLGVDAQQKGWAPFGPWVDIGFFGRMAAGAVAAPVFLVLVNKVLENTAANGLKAIATQADTLAWAVLIGAASPAAWQIGSKLVEARLGALQQKTELAQTAVDDAKKTAKALVPDTADKQVAAGALIGKLELTSQILGSGNGADIHHEEPTTAQ